MFFKNVLLAAAGSTFSFLDIQTFLCLFLGFSSRGGDVGGNVLRQSWVGMRRVRRCAFVFSLLSEMSSFGKCASGCSGKHIVSLFVNDV